MIEPKPYAPRISTLPIGVIDFETDPFLHGRLPRPFCVAFYNGETYAEFWGDDCAAQLAAFLATMPRHCIYAHNGGNFDFHFLLDYLNPGQTPQIVNGRMIRVELCGHEFRDSWAILPFALGKSGTKLEIDYALMERGKRDKHRAEILRYLRADCESLYRLVSGFRALFGDALTIGSVALPKLRSFHGFDTIGKSADEQLRPFFRGGRVECFQQGTLKGDWKVYDVNSMYPSVMRDFLHPVSGGEVCYGRKITPNTSFAFIRAKSRGALPWTDENGVTRYTPRNGDFYATIHEIEAGLETGTLRIHKVHFTIEHKERVSFADFVDHFYALRLEAKAAGDADRDLFYKLILNSAYGKFAIDPGKFESYHLGELDAKPPGAWEQKSSIGPLIIWAKPSPNRFKGYLNVATAASITGAARAQLWRGICRAKNVAYCDTDSIICEGFDGHVDPSTLGAWKLEKTGDTLAVAGKKLYALFDGDKCVKQASKGARLTPDQITRVANGEEITWQSMAPKFRVNGEHIFVERKINRTGNDLETELDYGD